MAIRSVVGVKGNDLYSGGQIRIYNRDPAHRGVVLNIKEEHVPHAEQALCLSADEVLALVEALLDALKEDMHHAAMYPNPKEN